MNVTNRIVHTFVAVLRLQKAAGATGRGRGRPKKIKVFTRLYLSQINR